MCLGITCLGVRCPKMIGASGVQKWVGRQVSRPRGYRRQVSKKLIGRQVSVRQVSRASIVSGVKGPRSFKRQMSLRQKSIFGRSMSKNLWQCMSVFVQASGVRASERIHPENCRYKRFLLMIDFEIISSLIVQRLLKSLSIDSGWYSQNFFAKFLFLIGRVDKASDKKSDHQMKREFEPH